MEAETHNDTHPIPNYMAIFWWLLGLTILEIAWAIIPHHSELILASGIVGLAIIKAVLVALYFMHLKFEKQMIIALAVAPLGWRSGRCRRTSAIRGRCTTGP